MRLSVSRRHTVAALAVILAALAAYFFVPGVHGATNEVVHLLTVADPQQAIQGFRDYLLGFGAWAPAVSAALMVLQSLIAPLPAFVVTFTNGLLFGWAWGAALSWASAMVGALLCFWIARALGRPAVERLVGGSKALEVADLFFARWGTRAILISRLLPFVSFDIISYGAGLTPVRVRSFLWATGLGQLPATLLYSYLGQNVSGSVRALFWVFSIMTAIFIAGWALGPAFLQRLRQRQARGGAGDATG